MAALYTAAVAPTLPWLVVLILRCLWIRPTGNCRPALAERDTALAFTLASFPALPPAWNGDRGRGEGTHNHEMSIQAGSKYPHVHVWGHMLRMSLTSKSC